MPSDEIDYQLIGDDLQAVIVTLDPEEAVVAEAGAMMYMQDGVRMMTSLDMQGRGTIVACDVRERRMRLLHDTVRATAVPNVRLVQIDSHGQLPFGRLFDRVLVDAPCSGLGTLRRDPDIKWRRTQRELPELAARQRLLLARAAAVVTPGGRLVYATCSSEPEENEQVVDAFLADHGDFSLVDLHQDLPPELAALVDAQGALRTSPVVGLESFYAAALARAR